jgi:hypothetical protein
MFGLGSLATKIIGGLLVVALILGILWLNGCEKRRSIGAQQKVERSQGEAASNSARDAIATQGQVNANEQASSDLGRQNEGQIRGSEGANVVVAPGVSSAGLESLCRREAYKNSSRCRTK